MSDEPVRPDASLPREAARTPTSDAEFRHPVEQLASRYLDRVRQGLPTPIDQLVSELEGDEREAREMLQLVEVLETWKSRREFAQMRASMPEHFAFDRLGDCRILREIGRGGMGVVFEAEQESMGRRVAVKVLPWRFPPSSRLRERFQREACFAAKLRHAHIVPVYRFGEHEGWCYFVMHLVPGIGLDQVIERLRQPNGELKAEDVHYQFLAARGNEPVIPEAPVRGWGRWIDRLLSRNSEAATIKPAWTLKRDAWITFIRFGSQVADALRYAHAGGILHRDIKPSNLMLDQARSLWVADFGLARIEDPTGQANRQDAAGTLRYCPLEQLRGAPDVRSDVYSLGMTLYELCTLRPALEGRTREELVMQVQDHVPPPPIAVNPRCPAALSDLIMRCIAKKPEDRFPTAAALLEALVRLAKARDRG